MRVRIHRELEIGLSLCGTLWAPGFSAVSLEREWKANEAGKSCVPAGFYYLEPHDGTKYKGTFALIGADVSHSKETGVQRYACVLHWAKAGMYLEGCISIGFKLIGELPEGATATDLVLTVTQILRAKGVVGKFVEFFGPGLAQMSLPDRATQEKLDELSRRIDALSGDSGG